MDPAYTKRPQAAVGPSRGTVIETQSQHESELTLSQILGEKKKKVSRQVTEEQGAQFAKE